MWPDREPPMLCRFWGRRSRRPSGSVRTFLWSRCRTTPPSAAGRWSTRRARCVHLLLFFMRTRLQPVLLHTLWISSPTLAYIGVQPSGKATEFGSDITTKPILSKGRGGGPNQVPGSDLAVFRLIKAHFKQAGALQGPTQPPPPFPLLPLFPLPQDWVQAAPPAPQLAYTWGKPAQTHLPRYSQRCEASGRRNSDILESADA